MPQLGETVTEGTITRWFKRAGDAVAADEPLFEVSTDKIDTDIPSIAAGVLTEVLVDEGVTVPVGTVVARLQVAGEVVPPPPVTAPSAHGPLVRSPSPDGDGRRDPATFLSPAVKRLLDEHGLRREDVVGTGEGGRVSVADVEAVIAGRTGTGPPRTPPLAPPRPSRQLADAEVVPLTPIRRRTAENLRRAVDHAVQTLVVTEVDWSAVERVRAARQLTFLPFVGLAVVDALARFPLLNASFTEDGYVIHRHVHLGVAVDVEHRGLVVPVVRDAHRLRLGALAEAMAERADAARSGRLVPDDLAGATFTLTNVGRYGTVLAFPVVVPPQVAILSTDGVRMRPAAVPVGDDWGVVVRPLGNLSLSFDHRAVDGAMAAAFLADVRNVLERRDWEQE